MTTRTPSLTLLSIVVAAAGLLVACDKRTTTDTTAGSTATTTTVSPSPAASNAMSATASAMNQTGDAASDALITGKVKTALLADVDVKGLKIDVDTKAGVVMLNGTADKGANSTKATTIAQNIDGVKSVQNNLTVTP